MKMNKKAAIHPALVVFGVIVAFIVLLAVWGSLTTWIGNLGGGAVSLATILNDSESIHELVVSTGGTYATNGSTYLKPVSYIVGEVPQAIVDATGPIGAIIVIALVFMILVFMFGDILDMFGSFSDTWIAWTIGTALAVIAANLKVVMLFAASGFMLVSGAGVLAAVLGVLVPFLVYILVHFLFLGNLGSWLKGKKTGKQFKASMSDIDEGIQGAKAFGKAIRKK